MILISHLLKFLIYLIKTKKSYLVFKKNSLEVSIIRMCGEKSCHMVNIYKHLSI